MHEIKINLHIHTRYSDGTGTHQEIARAALRNGLDALFITDHNVLVQGMEGYFKDGPRKLLMLVGEEIHNPTALPQKNHLLVFGAGQELSQHAANPQNLIDQVNACGGLSFLAHPNEHALPIFHEPAIHWLDRDVQGFTGIELWNGFSEIKSVSQLQLKAVFYAFFPHLMAHGPLPATLQLWDQWTGEGRRVVAVGGSDSHALNFKLGPLRKKIFPYDYHFRCVNTHLYLASALTGELNHDRRLILQALAAGHGFVGYDLPAPTDGFRFTAHGKQGTAWCGDEMEIQGSVTLQIRLPQAADCRLLKDGQLLKSWQRQEVCTFLTKEPGVYRVEVYVPYWGKKRGWIFSNPIYLRPARGKDAG